MSARSKGTRILVLDDDGIIRDLAREMISQLGYEAVCVGDGFEALDLYDASRRSGCPFDLVLADLTLESGMGGIEVVEHLRKLNPGIRVIAMSGAGCETLKEAHEGHGFKAAISKPFRFRQLEEAIFQALEEG